MGRLFDSCQDLRAGAQVLPAQARYRRGWLQVVAKIQFLVYPCKEINLSPKSRRSR